MLNKFGKSKFISRVCIILEILIPCVAIFFILDIPLMVTKISLFNQQFLAILWSLVLTLTFITTPVSKKFPKNDPKWYDLVLAMLTLIVGFYAAIFYPKILLGLGVVKPIEVVFGILAVILVIESVRRVTNIVVPFIILLFIAYAKFGYLMTGTLSTGEITWPRLFQQLYLGSDFMLGVALRVACGVVFAFIFFGNIFLKIGAGDFIVDLAYSAMGTVRGGPAKISIMASSLFGMISGSAVANVSAVGSLTIPLMKKTGYEAYYAGAVEATAGTGGQIMPPIMGAAAFVLAQFLGLPYRQVIFHALFPAILFYVGLFTQVDLQAMKKGLKGFSRENLPSLKKTLKEGWIYILPLVVLTICLFRLFLPAEVSAIYAGAGAVILSLFKKNTRALWNWNKVLSILQSTSRGIISVVVICAAAGFIIGIASYTGLGLSFSQLLIQIAGKNLLLLGLITAITSIILGMGMPTTAAYIMLAVLAAPAMIELGVLPIVAHLFIFYFGTLSMLTPPVCLSVYAAASISGAPPEKIALQSIKLAFAGYIVPFMFLFNHGILLIGDSILKIILIIFFAILSIFLFAFSFEGYLFQIKLGILARILFFAGGIILVVPNLLIRIFVCLVLGIISFYMYKKNIKTQTS